MEVQVSVRPEVNGSLKLYQAETERGRFTTVRDSWILTSQFYQSTGMERLSGGSQPVCVFSSLILQSSTSPAPPWFCRQQPIYITLVDLKRAGITQQCKAPV